MFVHYLKITFRNLLKYKTQNVISIVGLAIGLATYSLSSIWLKYETSYDTHWPDAERIYQIGEWEENEMEKFNEYTSLLTPNRLKEQFPEIETSCAFCHREVTEKGKKFWLLKADTAYPKSSHSPSYKGMTSSCTIPVWLRLRKVQPNACSVRRKYWEKHYP